MFLYLYFNRQLPFLFIFQTSNSFCHSNSTTQPTLCVFIIHFFTCLHTVTKIKGVGEAESRAFCNCMGWTDVSPSLPVTQWFTACPKMVSPFLSPHSSFLNPTEEIFSSWRWKVDYHQPDEQMSLLDTMNAGCLDISAEAGQGCIRYGKQNDSFPGVL